MTIKIIDFEEIQPVWYQEDMWGQMAYAYPVHDNLYWDGIKYFGGTDKRIRNLNHSRPVYYGYFIENKLVGVNSYFHVNREQCRSRGLYVFSEHRHLGIAVNLLKYAINQNRNKGYRFLWSMPRTSAVSAYCNAGFIITTNAFKTSPDGGPMLYENHYCRYDF